MDPITPPGWFGKLPCLGDFASRRLAPEFTEPWDRWLADELQRWRQRDESGWLAAYLAGPSWRFLISPPIAASGVGAPLLAGVLMPSVDKVGRYFPFTALLPLARLPGDRQQTAGLLAALHRLDDLAVDALQDDWGVEQLEAALLAWAAAAEGPWATHGVAAALSPGMPRSGGADEWLEQPAGGDFAAAFANALVHGASPGHTVWWSSDAQGQPRLCSLRGLPHDRHFRTLMTGLPATRSAVSPS